MTSIRGEVLAFGVEVRTLASGPRQKRAKEKVTDAPNVLESEFSVAADPGLTVIGLRI